ncbi:hypothetical protein COU12_02110 [Candidatus Jorgensenbacteria bacterium CG10_big_fil_rev_8_21_14_0_10_54_38]|uniref:Uncharacterized protein n=2 Tax=Candidatus Joergenseniibacteriota TaxID=1752739 RepID=A0A2M6WFQ3_9BACT|nr:MAG: hypothetical protein COX26_01515 [Candidatus Jorgensenbacteria bacterium CG23_combo_of_CG06-09_8_20_14_all_54_14]PIT91613.1 MAG: hypothetical protein COU12_02110 [Candidatus Jorgensenbacteria bacterium CG10_big_fil_rev_8_21_14_0_10_54_38]
MAKIVHALWDSVYQWFIEIPPSSHINFLVTQYLQSLRVSIDEDALSGVEDTEGIPRDVYRFPGAYLNRVLEMAMENPALKIRIFNRKGGKGQIRECQFLLNYRREIRRITAAVSQ